MNVMSVEKVGSRNVLFLMRRCERHALSYHLRSIVITYKSYLFTLLAFLMHESRRGHY